MKGDSVQFFIQKDSYAGWPEKDILQEGFVSSIWLPGPWITIKSRGATWTFHDKQYELGKITPSKPGVQKEKFVQIEFFLSYDEVCAILG